LSPDIRIALTPGLVAVAAPRLYRETRVAEGGDALATLGELLGSLQLHGRARVVLSQEFARVWMLPAPPVRLKMAEMKGWVHDQLARQFGDSVEGWRFAWQPTPPGQPVLTGAVEAGWFAAMQQILSEHGLKPVAVEPWLVAACARLPAALGRGGAWLALAEPGRITLARVERGAFRALRSSRMAGDPAAALAGMVARESLLAELADDSPVWLESVQVQADWRSNAGLEVRQAASAQTGLAPMMGN
jgi:hypothetical protein